MCDENECYLPLSGGHLILRDVDTGGELIASIDVDVHDVCPVLHGRGTEERHEGHRNGSEMERIIVAERNHPCSNTTHTSEMMDVKEVDLRVAGHTPAIANM